MNRVIYPSNFQNAGNKVRAGIPSAALQFRSNTTTETASPGRSRLKSAAFTRAKVKAQISGRAKKNRSIEAPTGFHIKNKDSE